MLVTIEIDPARRTAAFREVSYLAAGDSCRVVLDGVRGADFGTLWLALYRDAASDSPVASCASFAPVAGHPALADGLLALDTFEMSAWFAAAAPAAEESDSDSDPAVPRNEPRLAARASLAERSVRAEGWLVASDSDRVWAACRVPVLLRPGAGTSGASDPSSIRALVSELVAGLVSAALADKADKVPSAPAGNLASLDASGNLADSGATPASIKAAAVAEVVANAPGTMDTLKEIADILGSAPESGTVMSRISALESGKADSSSLAAVATSGSYNDLSNKPTIPAVDAALATEGAAADAKAVGDALDGKRGMDDLSYAADDWFVTGAAEMRLVRDSSFLPPMFGWSATVAGEKWFLLYGGPGSYWEFGVVNEYDARDWESGADATSLTFEIDGSVYNLTKGRRIALTKDIPTKTSQLQNDGDGASPFATEAGLAGRRGLSDRSFVRALSPESYRWSLSVPGGSAVELLPDPNGVQWASGSSDGDYALLKGALVSSGDRSWTLVELVSGSPSEVGGCVAAEGAGELDFGQGYVARHVRSEWGADDSLALSSEVDAAVAPKADAADLPYALVEPGEWEFSGSGYDSNETYRVRSQDNGGGDYTYFLESYDSANDDWAMEDAPLLNKTAAEMSLDFSGSEITATRASLPGHLCDRAVNAVSDESALVLPPLENQGKSRDLLVRMTLTSSTTVTVSPTSPETVTWDSAGSPSGTYEAGTYLFRFTEVSQSVFHFTDLGDGGSIDPAVLNGKLEATSAAPAFDPTKTYSVGEHVTYNGVLYECSTAVTTAGSWTGSTNWTATDMTSPDATLDLMANGRLRLVSADGEVLWMQGYGLASASSVTLSCDKVNFHAFAAATAFDATVSYAANDIVAYDGVVYVFTSAHSAGAWTGSDATVYAVALAMPTAPSGKVGDFVLDVDNTANASASVTATLTGAGTAFDVFTPEGVNLSTDILTFAGGEQCELYFTMTAFGTAAKPAWKVVKQTVEKQEFGS